jgi:E3 ubiquitin-protein ligase HUWE1
MISIKENSKEGEEAKSAKEESAASPMDQSASGDSATDGDEATAAAVIPMLEGLNSRERTSLLTSCVGLIGIPADRDALNAVLRLCLRLTQDFDQATLFTKLGGVKALLGLTQSSNFNGFASLATLLVRHVMEDPATLRYAMEKVVRSQSMNGNSANTKEIHYLLRVLGPAACRAPELFAEVAEDILRVDLALLNKRGVEPEEDPRLLVKSLPPKAGSPTAAPGLQDVSHSVICDLLNFLVQGEPENSVAAAADGEESAPGDPAAPACPCTGAPTVTAANRTQAAILRNSSSGDLHIPTAENAVPGNSAAVAAASAATSSEKEEKSKSGTSATEDESSKKKQPLMSKSSVCRLLAELVKSYGGCAKLITEHVYEAGISDNIKEDTTSLAYLFDELLIGKSDKELGHLVKTLIAALASCNQHSEAQATLVSEVKAAITRALAWQESGQKHVKIQALTTLVSTMIESCPSSQQTQQNGLNAYKQQQFAMNNIVKMMLKRGLISDLARVPHSLDLSSPNVAATVNAALKPLEILTRIVNQPTATGPPSRASAKARGGAANGVNIGGDVSQATNPGESIAVTTAGNGAGTNTTNSDATRAQGDELNVEPDAEATEHDISTAAESIEPNSESQLQVRSIKPLCSPRILQ